MSILRKEKEFWPLPINKSILMTRAGLGRRGFGIYSLIGIVEYFGVVMGKDKRMIFDLCRNREN